MKILCSGCLHYPYPDSTECLVCEDFSSFVRWEFDKHANYDLLKENSE